MLAVFLIFLFILGACFGSFLCCTARRLRLKEQGKKNLGSRSVCLHCKRQLAWYDNLPLISWLILKGRCRYCHARIGSAEFLSEFFSALAFLLLGLSLLPILPTFAPFSTAPTFTAPLLVTLFFLVLALLFLAIYDGLYGELPMAALTISIICAIILLTLRVWASFSVGAFSPEIFFPPLIGAILILPGLYFVLYKLGRGKWVGDGDWLLALALALVLADPFLSLLTLFFANFLACLYAFPFILKSPKPITSLAKTHGSTTVSSSTTTNSSPRPLASKLHFGPFLVAAFVLVFAFADFFQNLL